MQDTFTTAKSKLGRTKPSTGPHADRGLDIAALDYTQAEVTVSAILLEHMAFRRRDSNSSKQ